MSLITESLPIYHCNKITRPLILSGALRDPVWRQAEPADLFDIYGRPGRFKTQVRLLYDEKFLYVGFTCEDDYVWSTITERDGSIWEQECVEVFLNPANTIHQYYEINVNPLNTVFDACILNGCTANNLQGFFQGFPQFNLAALHTAVHICGECNKPGLAEGWSAELAIPFNELPGADHIPPQSGDRWHANFYRIDQPYQAQPEHYAWSKTERVAFHQPWRFGTLQFC